MSEKIPPRFRKTKTDKWAVMAPVEDLEKALAEGGKIDVQKKSGDWSSFTVGSLGRPFDVDGVQMCYGYGPEAEGDGSDNDGRSDGNASNRQARGQSSPDRAPRQQNYVAPTGDPSEPIPEYQGDSYDEWDGGF